jgi:hypothetical protein
MSKLNEISVHVEFINENMGSENASMLLPVLHPLVALRTYMNLGLL